MFPSQLEPTTLASRLGSWLSQPGVDGDVVVSTRIRLARNLEGRAFVARLSPEEAREVANELREVLDGERLDGETWWVPMEEASPLLRLLLRERHLISRDLVPGGDQKPVPPGRAVALGETEALSVMVNEEDHLRIQSMASGFDLDTAWERVLELDQTLEKAVPYAFDERYGYLTGCPTNVGTGLRASVMLHLPALGLARTELERVFTACQRTGLAVRGLYGEGSGAAGDFYQISNQTTLGREESQLIDDLRALVPKVVQFERKVRDALLEDKRSALQDRVSRSYGLLRTARSLTTADALRELSQVRLGLHLGLFQETSLERLTELSTQVQRGHVQALSGGAEAELPVSERDRERASLCRRLLTASGS